MTTEQQKLLLQTLLVCWRSPAIKKEVLLIGRRQMTLDKYIEKNLKKCGYKIRIGEEPKP